MAHLTVYQHVIEEGPAGIAAWAASRGHQLTVINTAEAAQLPAPRDALVVMGGPMGVGDLAELPWLTREADAIAAHIAAGVPVIGVCLGSQLLAHALGGSVVSGHPKEIGWFPIQRTAAAASDPIGRVLPAESLVFHWHGDRILPPAGASVLATSPGCPCQAFRHGPHLGLQCHLEVNDAVISEIAAANADELVPATWVAERADLTGDAQRVSNAGALLERLLDAWWATAVS